jgi:hypothetical protein
MENDMGQVIQFPNVGRPSFTAWMSARFQGKKWHVAKTRRMGGKFGFSPDRDVILLGREYDALAAEYEARFGARYA